MQHCICGKAGNQHLHSANEVASCVSEVQRDQQPLMVIVGHAVDGAASQVASIGDVSDCTYLSNVAGTDGPAVYAFNCAGRIYNNAFANEPVNAVRHAADLGAQCPLRATERIRPPLTASKQASHVEIKTPTTPSSLLHKCDTGVAVESPCDSTHPEHL